LLEEVLVTAQKREQRVTDVPMSIAVLSGEFMSDAGIDDSTHLAFKTLNSNGWQKSVSRDEKLGEQDKSAVRLMVDIDLGEKVNLLLTASYWDDHSDSLAPQFLEGGYANLGPVADLIRPHEPLGSSIGNNAKDAEWISGRTPVYDMENTSLGRKFGVRVKK